MARYSSGTQKTVKQAMHKRKEGTLKSGSGKKVKSRKQAIAIGLSEARKKGTGVPQKNLHPEAEGTLPGVYAEDEIAGVPSH